MNESRHRLDPRIAGYGLTTAQIIYRMPDHPRLLQTYIWQDYDIAPDFPEMRGFLRFWQESIEGALYCVRYSHRRLIGPREWRSISGEMMLQ